MYCPHATTVMVTTSCSNMCEVRQSIYLNAAEGVLQRAGRSMHYTQITSVAIRLGLLETKSKTAAISMSSILSEDIRTNPQSKFLKRLPGIYDLAEPSGTVFRTASRPKPLPSNYLERLKCRLNMNDTSAVVLKALYLAGRSLDMAGNKDRFTYRRKTSRDGLEITIAELSNEFDTAKRSSTSLTTSYQAHHDSRQ